MNIGDSQTTQNSAVGAADGTPAMSTGVAHSAPAHNSIERAPTGVPGLDELVEGGIPHGRIVLLSGASGAGKTTFGFQFLHHGITACDEPGVFVSLEEEIGDLYQEMGRYGWDLAELVDQKKLVVIKSAIPVEVSTPLTVDAILDQLHAAVTRVNAKRIVFDSLAALGLCYTNGVNLRRDVLRLCDLLRELGCTTLLTTEAPEGDIHSTCFGIEQLVTQGMIVLHVAQTYRALEIRKMRATRHDTNVHRLRLTERGLLVSPGEHPF